MEFELVQIQCDRTGSGADVTFSIAHSPDIVLLEDYVARSSVLSTMVESAGADETFTAPKGYLQAWSQLVQDDIPHLMSTTDLDQLLVLLKVRCA